MRRNACGFIETLVPGKLQCQVGRAKPEVDLARDLFRRSLSRS